MKSLIQDTLQIKSLNRGNYERKGTSDIYDLNVTFDVNKDLINIDQDKVYFFALKQDESKKMNYYDPKNQQEDEYKDFEYVTHGTIFEINDIDNEHCHVGISFGGLLMSLQGKKIHMKKLKNDEKVFCMFKQNN